MNFLKKLFSKKPAEPADVPPEFLQENPPDWLLDLKGRGLPRGGAFSIRVQLFTATRAGAAELLVLPQTEGEQPKSAAAALARNELDKLFVILGFSFPRDIESVASDVIDGLPVTVSIYRREPPDTIQVTCNLAGWLDSRQSKPPAIEIGLVLLEIQKRALPQ